MPYPGNASLSSANDPGILAKEAEAAFFLEFNRAIAKRSRVIDGLFAQTSSQGADEDYATITSVPVPKIWERGNARSWDGVEDVNINILNYKWQANVTWATEDREDDRTGTLLPTARSTGQRFAQLDERVALQIIQGATDSDLLPAIPNAYDGVALVSGSSRFGNASGNTIAGSGVATVNAIITDLYAAMTRFASFQDTKGEPYFLDEDIKPENMRIIAANSNRQVFMQALRTKLIPAGALSSTSNAGVDNPFLLDTDDMGADMIYFTQRLTGNDWYLYLDVPFAKPLVKQTRTEMITKDINRQNSDESDNRDVEGVTFRQRIGYGVGAPQVFLKINN